MDVRLKYYVLVSLNTTRLVLGASIDTCIDKKNYIEKQNIFIKIW